MLFRRRLGRAIACFFLLETLLTILAPGVTWAISGPGQPEFTSYESPGSTDMVNMTTGDLTYNLPILDIPGPERGISLPLTYRAGIKLEQEASWVGLGWSLNPGAIARSLNGYPDDVSDYPYNTTFKKDINRGWYGGILGVIDLGWDSETGHSGTVDLLGLASVSWAGGKFSGADLIGVKYTKGEGISVDPVRMAMAGVTIATAGASATLSVGASLAIQAGGSVATGTVMGLVGRAKGTNEFNQATVRKEKNGLFTRYWVYYDKDTYEYMYGSLYFRDMSKSVVTDNRWPKVYKDVLYGAQYQAPMFNRLRGNNQNQWSETAADLHQPSEPGVALSYYATSMRPTSIAHDDFSVMGGDATGSIRPQLLEVGSVSMPQRSTNLHDKYSVTAYLDDYKIPFRYENSLSNGYDYHRYTPNNTEAVGIDHSAADQAVIIKDPRLMELYDASTRTAAARKGIRNSAINGSSARRRGLDQGKHVAWYTNSEISSGNAPKLLKSDWEAQMNGFRLTLPGKGIGAFAVTTEDGTTYHYSLPVYHLGTYSQTDEILKPGQKDAGKATTTMGQDGKVYATTWALTAITSADYVDRGQIGVVDDADWGGWVTFSYGRLGQRYKWRQPYIAGVIQGQGQNNGSVSFTVGAKETYYLNTIHTRTHTALFVKSMRNDARGHFGSSYLNLPDNGPASSLRLDEIVLLNNTDWDKLQKTNGIRYVGDNGGLIPALTANTGNNANTWDNAELRGGDSYASVLDSHDLDEDARIRAFINERATKRVRFNFSYDLCSGAPNSFPSAIAPPPMDEARMAQGRTGKLTLESVSIYGPQNTKIVPDYRFSYAHNPNYGKDKWDGFGMYNRNGLASTSISAHTVSNNLQQASEDGAAWSLTEIVDPLGGRTQIQYERDQYNHVSEHGVKVLSFYSDNHNSASPQVLLAENFAGDLRDYYKDGEQIHLTGKVKHSVTCYPNDNPGIPFPASCEAEFDRWPTVYNVTRNTLEISIDPRLLDHCSITTPPGNNCPGPMHFDWLRATTDAVVNRNGGDIRVANITVMDESNNRQQVRYRYYQDPADMSTRNSSGVIGKEPSAIEREYHDFDAWYDYPATPVMYGKVTVLRGAFKTGADADHDVREEYTFYTPNSGMIERNAAYNTNGGGYTSHGFPNGRSIERMDNRWVVNTGLIGQAISIKRFNRRGEQEFATTFNYANQVANPDGIAGQGRFTEGLMTNELLDNRFYRINRSTKEYVPTVMTSSTTIANNMRVDNINDLYDFFTGQVVESHAKNSLGQEFSNKTMLAYAVPAYASMGLKSADDNNANMLTQPAATYVFKRGAGGSLALLSSEVQTWKNNWGYREFNAGADRYEEVAAPKAVWRMYESYVWNGTQLNADGTKAGFVAFNWDNISPAGQHADWLRTSEMTLYNQYSQPLESRDMNGRYASSKAGSQHTVTMATAQNARYSEFAYSGAEDQLQPVYGNTSVTHFGGEVRDGNRRSSAYAHAGIYSSLVGAGQTGFTYRALVGTDITTNRKYRLSVWVRGEANANTQANLAGAKVYASLNGTRLAEISAASATTKKAGDWFLVDLYFDLATADIHKELTVGCENSGGNTVYFDDFRFQPLVSSVTAQNFDPHTGQTTYVLDNDNLFTRYEYDRAGKLVRVYRETLDRPGDITPVGGRKIKEYAYHYARSRSYTIQAGVEGSGQVNSSLPGGLVNQVEIDGSVIYTATSNSCEWYFSGLKVNNVYMTNGSLADGTVVSLLDNGCRLSNVRGNHNVTLVFHQHPASGTEVYSECEICPANGRYTGIEFYHVADGCGGITRYSRPSNNCRPRYKEGAVPPIEDCPVFRAGKRSKRTNVVPMMRHKPKQ